MQSYASHARYYPIFHFIALPLFVINIVVATVIAVRNPSFATVWGVVLALGLLILLIVSRTQALRAQDRLIGLEERLRLAKLAPELGADAERITPRQFVAIRFASDGELPGLVRRVLAGELATMKSIKQAIGNWRDDRFRV
jgi:hypothetical protein